MMGGAQISESEQTASVPTKHVDAARPKKWVGGSCDEPLSKEYIYQGDLE